MVGARQGDGAKAVLAGELDGSCHREVGVEVAGAAIALPALDGAEGSYEGGFSGWVDNAGCDLDEEAREAGDAVSADAVEVSLSEEGGG